jgi:phosphoglycerate-specific signal transduction histidine kinase
LLMEDRGREQEDLEAKVGELEKLTDSLNEVPDEELVETLDEAVELLGEINARIENRLDAAGEESREIGDLLGQVDFGPFDEAMEGHEHRERTTGEPGA